MLFICKNGISLWKIKYFTVNKGEFNVKDLIIVGAGGHGREVLEWILDINEVKPTWNVLGFIDDDEKKLDEKKVNIR